MRQLRRRWLLVTAVLVGALLAGGALAALGAGSIVPSSPNQAAIDPTPVPTATPPSLVPPDPMSAPPAPPVPRDAPKARVALPGVADLMQGSNGAYAATAKDGCRWIESYRGPSSLTKQTIVILRTSCSADTIVQYFPDSKALVPVSVMEQPAGKPGSPPPTPEPDATEPLPLGLDTSPTAGAVIGGAAPQ